MDIGNLHTVWGGYNKKDVMRKIDAYKSLIVLLEKNSLSWARVNAELEKIHSAPIRKMFVLMRGYSVTDTEAAFEKLEQEVKKHTFLS